MVLEPEWCAERYGESVLRCEAKERTEAHPCPISKSDRFPPKRQRRFPVSASM